MKNNLRAVLLLALLSTQQAFSANTKQVSDNQIYDQVRMRLTGDVDVKGGALQVSVKDGSVTLTGRVDTDRAKSKATKLSKKVKGVKSVDNELTVGPPSGI